MIECGIGRRAVGRLVVVGAAVGMLLSAQPVAAQTALRPDASAGYLGVGSMKGWYAQFAMPTSARWSIVGQFDVSNGAECSGCEPDYHDRGILFGVRVGGSHSRISPFVQVLGGVLDSKREAYYYDAVVGYDNVSKQWIEGKVYSGEYKYQYTALQPGGGLTVMLTPHVGVRAGADFQLAFHEEGVSMFPRVMAGGVIRLGRP